VPSLRSVLRRTPESVFPLSQRDLEMSVLAGSTAAQPKESESVFYSAHAWCLNPLSQVAQLLGHCQEELHLLGSVSEPWQRQECRINLYLLTCAVSSTVADYLGPSIPSFAPLANRFPQARKGVAYLEFLVHSAYSARNRMQSGHVFLWMQHWRRCVDLACDILVRESTPADSLVEELASYLQRCKETSLPPRLLSSRAQLPSGFRAQDLSHYDVVSLADEFARAKPTAQQSVAIVGARTAGAYFAPLIAAQLRCAGWPKVSWTSVRPKSGTSPWEAQELRAIAQDSSRVVIVDDHPDTGHTMRLMVDLLGRFQIARERITILVPSHPAQKDSSVLSGGSDVEVVTEPWERSHKLQFLQGRAQSLLEEHFSREGWEEIHFEEDSRTSALNERLAKSCGDGFYARLKKVFSVSGRCSGQPVHRYVVAKSTGWGWFGYHGYLAGTRLKGFVPSVLMHRDGVLFSEWIASPDPAALRAPCIPTATEVANYVARRAELLAIEEDPCFEGWRYGSTGWYALLRTLRAPFGPFFSRFKIPVIWRSLRKYVPRYPAFIDARMKPEEWIRTSDGIRKVDYEHHGFGNPALNVADPAHDLATAVFSLGLTKEEETELVRQYGILRKDPDLKDRLILHKLICGRVAEEAARYKFAHADSEDVRRLSERNRISARDFLVRQMNQFFADRFPASEPAQWSDKVCFLDLDGVFDKDRFYFPHTTPAGMLALRKLQAAGFSVVVNSGRSVQHIRNYTSSYSLAGGLGEYGCVFVDGVQNTEHSLVPEPAQEQLERFRRFVSTSRGIFSDPTYLYAVRIYRVQDNKYLGLTAEELNKLLEGFDQLTFLTTSADSYIIPKEAGKGWGVTAVKEHLNQRLSLTAAVGDSRFDVPMLKLVDRAYFLSNGSSKLRGIDLGKNVTITRRHFQTGLLEAAEDLLRQETKTHAKAPLAVPACYPDSSHIIEEVLLASERPGWRQMWSLLSRRSF
jgi:hydroxymethylpyrimidine pyrophosphatase-like HAD family hydrolase/adenine/guanine phosphoribosyltransferase-like PRPP-binding protein